MVITGTHKIANLLEIPSLKQQIKKNQSLTIKDDSFWNHDVQVAVKMGYISTDSSENSSSMPVENLDKVEFKNVSNKPITISGMLVNHGKIFKENLQSMGEPNPKKNKDIKVSVTVLPNASIFIHESDLNNEDLLLTVKAGLLKQISSPVYEPAVKNNNNTEEFELETTEDCSDKRLDFNEEIVIKRSNNKDKDDPRRFSIIVDPNHNDRKPEIDGAVVVTKGTDEIDFVNDVKPHPKLDKKLSQNNKEIDFVD